MTALWDVQKSSLFRILASKILLEFNIRGLDYGLFSKRFTDPVSR